MEKRVDVAGRWAGLGLRAPCGWAVGPVPGSGGGRVQSEAVGQQRQAQKEALVPGERERERAAWCRACAC